MSQQPSANNMLPNVLLHDIFAQRDQAKACLYWKREVKKLMGELEALPEAERFNPHKEDKGNKVCSTICLYFISSLS